MIRVNDPIRSIMIFALVVGFAVLFTTGCALNPSNDPDPDPEPDPTGTLDRTSPTKLITEYLPSAYSQMDSTAYEAALDDAFVFELLSSEVDPNDPTPWWDKFEELGITGNMFNARYNDAGQRVDRIRLEMTERSNVVDNTNYPDKPPTEEWRKVTALVDLLVVVEDPEDPEGIINFVVASNQIFTVRPDPDVDTLYAIYKQVDQEAIN